MLPCGVSGQVARHPIRITTMIACTAREAITLIPHSACLAARTAQLDFVGVTALAKVAAFAADLP
jgi:hypothetical protein